MPITKPPWLKVRFPGLGRYYEVRKELGRLGVHTVCEEAHCPNAAECWGGGTATLMILGDVCTRGCRFCAVQTGHPSGPPAADEPERVAEAAAQLGLHYVVITSVDRDDLPDGGAAHFATTVSAIRARLPAATVELLTPDFGAREDCLRVVAGSGAEVLGHNLETVRSLTTALRDRRCGYDLSLRVLERYRALAPDGLVKSSLLLGVGESEAEVLEGLADLRAVGVDWITLGQYLRPTRKHAPVRSFIPPEKFAELGAAAKDLGFPLVTAGPLVRSSYRAAEEGAVELLQRRRRRAT